MTEAAMEFLLDNLNLLMNNSYDSSQIQADMEHFQSLYEELTSLKPLLKGLHHKTHDHDQVHSIFRNIRHLTDVAEDTLDSLLIKNITNPPPSLDLNTVVHELKAIKNEVMGVRSSSVLVEDSSMEISYGEIEGEFMVGFEEEAVSIVERLTEGQKQLDVISIVGMAGLGKTTLAMKVYNDPFVVYRFHVRAWTYVSQVYRKRDLLLNVLGCVIRGVTDDLIKLSNQKLGEKLYKSLKGKRYLIVMDDVWDIEAWNDFKRYFPNDSNGSRIVITSRITDLGVQIKPDSPPVYLRFLTQEEGWELFQRKVFGNEQCCVELMEVGKHIVGKCAGLPLAIVVIAGILAKEEKKLDFWEQVAESVSDRITSDPVQCMDTLSLSYKHLAPHLIPCFLYFGVFPEDYEIRTMDLIWLWIAEGFIPKIQGKRVEEVAESYLKDLIQRSLVMVSKRKSSGGIKACRLHDLLHDLCLKKAKDENFLYQIHKLEQGYDNQRRLCIHSNIFEYVSTKPSALRVRSFLCITSERGTIPEEDASFAYEAFKLLRVLDLRSIGIYYVPDEIDEVVHLRFLGLRPHIETLPSSISNLVNLETLFLEVSSDRFDLPNIWKMAKLRHVHITGRTFLPHPTESTSESNPLDSKNPLLLENLQTLSFLHISHRHEELLARMPNLIKLAFMFFEPEALGYDLLPNLECLSQLENLKLVAVTLSWRPQKLPSLYKLPLSLKKLSLSELRLDWTEISIVGKLPNLEVLKLVNDAFLGPLWEMHDDEFLKLKFLKMKNLSVTEWVASENHFPCLQVLVLNECGQLEEIPSALGDIYTLQKIELSYCSKSAICSAREIQEQQQCMGYDGLKVFIYCPDSEPASEEDQSTGPSSPASEDQD